MYLGTRFHGRLQGTSRGLLMSKGVEPATTGLEDVIKGNRIRVVSLVLVVSPDISTLLKQEVTGDH